MSMDVAPIITQMGSISELNQVLEPTTGGSLALLNTTAELVTLFGSTFANNIWPLTVPESDSVLPHMVYQRVSSAPGIVDGFHILQQDSFVLTIRDTDYDNMVADQNTVIGLMASSAFELEVTDILEDFDEARNAYVTNMEVLFTYIDAASQTLPMAFVYPLQRQANDTEHDSFVAQLTRNEYGILLITTGSDMPALLTAVEENLLGFLQSSTFQEVRYLRGNALEGVSSMHIWREVYFDANHLRET